MAVNARTFQILYIIHTRDLVDQSTAYDDFASFIAERRKSAPDTYSRAYISPSALVPLLDRMLVGQLITHDLISREYSLTPRGSQMADLLDFEDACTNYFIDNYKKLICLAVIRQRQQLGLGPISSRDAAAIANISRDSARRGMIALAADAFAIESRSDSTPEYSLPTPETSPATLTPPVTPEEDGAVNTPADSNLDIINAVLSEIDESNGIPMDFEDDEDPLISLNKILQGDDDDDDQPRFNLPTPTIEDEDPVTDVEEPLMTEEEPVVEESIYVWGNVDKAVQDDMVSQAKALGMTLENYIYLVVWNHQKKMREALFGELEEEDYLDD